MFLVILNLVQKTTPDPAPLIHRRFDNVGLSVHQVHGEKRKHEAQVTVKTDSKSLTITETARTIALSVQQLTNSQSEQVSKEISRTPETFKDDSSQQLLGFHTFPGRM
ncbi:hypothetical protein AVEN_167209-1 [Araneus ventricosus]|uniref:Uncharacterized protein n=1 Tax=Araneus ventricosus TaxID=182803 RepID=A0A4Y2G5E6_ARAVE|nr:hypothetical protein AVEN_197605-1 [Araneus ventricosus]GBM49085.1 hypothetical protein AVEN_228838-1 [Araneus ventricosus]GBM49130.1 hypothetical protein AVEN_132382-1 [Araneus ventricosus]GBM49166.1 hypothetical protein AVEN_167209-1 [Araneus ventricosus]